MANRRKFLAGIGSLAAGSAAAVGSGAFAVSNVDRGITVQKTGDDSAYLGLVPDSQYAEITDQTINISFDKLNPDADFSFRNVFYVQNNGENDIRVQLIDGDSGIDFANDSPMVVSYTDSRDQGTEYSNLNAFPNSPNWIGDTSYGHSGPDSAASTRTGFLDLSPGDTAHIHFDFFLDDNNENSETNENVDELNNPQSIDKVPEEIGFYASALPEDGTL